MKKLLSIIMCASLLLLTACSNKESDEAIKKYESFLNDTNPRVAITFKDYGKIELELFEEVAPITVANFLDLVRKGFYDNLTMHRIISGFMIQGGDPEGNGTGGSEGKIYGEFLSNGFTNTLSHTRGVISMARSNDPNSASSQFFIVHEDSTFLDGNYASFGAVINGFDTLDKIANVKVNGETPVEKVIIEKVEITREAKEIIEPTYYDPNEIYNNEKNPKYILDDNNPDALVTLSNGKTFNIELFPNNNKTAVDHFINLAENNAYNGKKLANQGDATIVEGTFENIIMDSENNDLAPYQKAVGFNKMLTNNFVIPNSSGTIFTILNNYYASGDYILNLFGFITEGFEDYLASLDGETTIDSIKINYNGYTKGEVKTVNLTTKPSSEFIKNSNPQVKITLSNDKSFTVELFNEVSPENVNYFLEADLTGRKITYLFKDQVFFVEGKDIIEGSKAEIPFNGIENNISNDKYTLFMYYESLLENTNLEFGINLVDNKQADNLQGVFGKVVSGTEVIDEINNLETTNDLLITEEITIKSVERIR